jgi:hypothetical protein
MANTTKSLSKRDGQQVLQSAFNDVDGTLSTGGFLTGKVGHKVELVISTTSVANDTETYTFSDSANQLYVLTLIYTDGDRCTLLSAERTA